MTNQEIIEKIRKWQNSPCTHDLTCGYDKCNHISLKAIEEKNIVILKCTNPNCTYTQKHIPECVLDANLEELEKLYNKMIKNSKKGNNK